MSVGLLKTVGATVAVVPVGLGEPVTPLAPETEEAPSWPTPAHADNWRASASAARRRSLVNMRYWSDRACMSKCRTSHSCHWHLAAQVGYGNSKIPARPDPTRGNPNSSLHSEFAATHRPRAGLRFP